MKCVAIQHLKSHKMDIAASSLLHISAASFNPQQASYRHIGKVLHIVIYIMSKLAIPVIHTEHMYIVEAQRRQIQPFLPAHLHPQFKSKVFTRSCTQRLNKCFHLTSKYVWVCCEQAIVVMLRAVLVQVRALNYGLVYF